MKPEYKHLNQLNDKTDAYKVKVKVIQKSSAQQSPTKPTRYQRLVLKDEKGNTMKATIFNKDIEGFSEALQRNGEYEISGAPIQPVPEKFQSKTNEFQMTLNDKVAITPLTTDQTSLVPQYLTINTLPRDTNHEDLLDLLGIGLFVDETKTINRTGYPDNYVREVVVTDDSTERPIVISAWNDLARTDCNVLNTWAQAFVVVGFTALRTRPHKGLSLATTMSSEIIIDPQGAKADALRAWVLSNETILEDRRAKVMQLRAPPSKRLITTVDEVNARTASKTWIEERFWLKVISPNTTKEDIYQYLGCSKCGRKGGETESKTFHCQACSTPDAVAIKRLAFRINAMDETGSLKLTMFNNHVETLCRMACNEIVNCLAKEEKTTLDQNIESLHSTPYYLLIGPTNALTKSHILSWAVRDVAFE